VIKVRGLTKRYGSTVAVDRLSFDVPPGAAGPGVFPGCLFSVVQCPRARSASSRAVACSQARSVMA
jgi:hypothetical protein